MDLPTRESFLNDVKGHKFYCSKQGDITIMGMSKNNTRDMSFEIIFMGSQCQISGDMGTYVFERVESMIGFFRKKDLKIKPSYWGEKLISTCRENGYVEFDKTQFTDAVYSEIDQWEYEDQEQKDLIRGEVERCIDGLECEIELRGAIDSFVSSRADEFIDFQENNFDKYTYNYTWCLYAICHAINRYDEWCSQQSGSTPLQQAIEFLNDWKNGDTVFFMTHEIMHGQITGIEIKIGSKSISKELTVDYFEDGCLSNTTGRNSMFFKTREDLIKSLIDSSEEYKRFIKRIAAKNKKRG